MSNPEEFTVVGQMPLADIGDGLKRAPLLQKRDVFPFEGAGIWFRWVGPDEVYPTSLIAVERKLERQGIISAAMRATVERGYDQYELKRGGVILEGGPEGRQGMIPPVVVDAKTLEGEPRLGILDGLHRAYDCFMVQNRRHLWVAQIVGASPDWQAYAYTNEWDEIEVVDEKPKDKRLWKHYVGDPLKNEEYGLYVDFGHLNGSRPYVPGQN